MSRSPKISVVLTCYNLGRYLDEAVDSVLAQTFTDFEILIVDDGSTEPDTIALLTGYERPQTRVLRIANRGLSGARNEGIRQTTGAYVCTLDADDLLERTYFEKAVAVLDGDSTIAFVSHWLRTFGDEEREWTPLSADFPALLDMNSVNGAALVRREALYAAGLYDETMRDGCEDWDLWISMVERGLRGVILPEVLFFYRRRRESMSRVMMEGRTHVDLYRYLIEKHRASFEAHLIPLLLRREDDRTGLLRQSHELELDCHTVLAPESAHLRENLRMARRKQERSQGRRTDGASDQTADLAPIKSGADDVASAQLDVIMREMEAALAERARVLDELDTELGVRARVIADRDAELTGQRQVITSQAVELNRFAAAVAERNAEIEQTHRLAGALQAQLVQELGAGSALRREVDLLRSSRSWRLTQPLRALYALLSNRNRG
jgi:GT2 family glycosyltransferase